MTTARHDADGSPGATATTAIASPAVEDALRALARAFSAVQLYLPNNQQRAQRLADARQAFAQLWRVGDALELEVRESSFAVGGQVMYQEAERSGESLPWLLYRDGIRALTITAGFEDGELEAFLALLQSARSANSDDDDLVTLLWVADLAHLSYRFLDSYGVDSLSRGGARPGQGSAGTATPAIAEFSLPVQAANAERGDGAGGNTERETSPFIRMEDFDSALYFLDAQEASVLQEELARMYDGDPRRPVLDGLLDLLETGACGDAEGEVVDAIDRLVVECLTAGSYELVAYALREADAIARRATPERPVSDRLAALSARLSEPKAVAQLLIAIDDSARTPATALLEELFRELRPAALEPLVQWLGTATASPARAGVERASLRLARAHLAELSRLLEHPDPGVVRGALKIATPLASTANVPSLARLLRSEDVRLRLDSVTALAAVGSPGAMQALERAIEDPDREVRVAIYRTIAGKRHAGALPRLLGVLRGKESRAADLGEKMALFEAFGSLCGEAGVAELDGILNSRGLLGAKEPPEFRACAARALGLVGTPSAHAALQRASDAKEVVVRSAVLRAMREGA